MPRFAANLSMLFTEVPFLDRFERAARTGFEAVEFLFPYEFPAEEIRARIDKHQLQARVVEPFPDVLRRVVIGKEELHRLEPGAAGADEAV